MKNVTAENLLQNLIQIKHKLYRKLKLSRGNFLDRLGWYDDPSEADKTLCFILSTGRTGTTFLGNKFFPSFENVTSFHEPQPDFFDLGVKMARGELSDLRAARIIEPNRRWILNKMEKLDNNVYVEANHYLFSLVSVLQKIYSDARFIHVVRDGRDFVRSAYNRNWYSTNSRYDRITARDFPEDSCYDRWAKMTRFEKIAWHWQKKDRFIEKALEEVQQSVRVYFESVFDAEKNYAGLRKMVNFLNLDAGIINEIDLSKKRSTGSYQIPHWSDWDEDEIDKFKQIAGKRLQKHGYGWEEK